MSKDAKPYVVLMADDDEDDRLLARDAFDDCGVDVDLRFVEDGVELLDYLHAHGPWTDSPRPSLIILDLNMPRKDGREALAAIKENPSLRRIPVVVLTTSKAEEDVLRSYDLGVSSFISKPVSYASLLALVRTLSHYWFETVRLPGHAPAK
ncbi:MAG TPA: response regulator [Candidatus Binatia bacterium]